MSSDALLIMVYRADDPERNKVYISTPEEAAERFPEVADIITDREFVSLEYTVALTSVSIQQHN